jgi:hypothetical protein
MAFHRNTNETKLPWKHKIKRQKNLGLPRQLIEFDGIVHLTVIQAQGLL